MEIFRVELVGFQPLSLDKFGDWLDFVLRDCLVLYCVDQGQSVFL